MSVKVRCTECGAVSQDGVFSHNDTCSAITFHTRPHTDYLRPPGTTIEFDTPEEQKAFMDKLGTSSGTLKTSIATQTPTNNTDRLVTTGDFPKCLCCGRDFISGGDLCKACEKYVHRYTQKMVNEAYNRGYNTGFRKGFRINNRSSAVIKQLRVIADKLEDDDRIITIEKEMDEK